MMQDVLGDTTIMIAEQQLPAVEVLELVDVLK